jgi:hypothetical protein
VTSPVLKTETQELELGSKSPVPKTKQQEQKHQNVTENKENQSPPTISKTIEKTLGKSYPTKTITVDRTKSDCKQQ